MAKTIQPEATTLVTPTGRAIIIAEDSIAIETETVTTGAAGNMNGDADTTCRALTSTQITATISTVRTLTTTATTMAC